MALFKVVVELFPIEWSENYANSFLNEAKNDQNELIRLLRETRGIYCFYNSELEIIYLGKTKDNLWSEMKNAYMRPMPHYSKYKVNHPRGRYKYTEEARKMKLVNLKVWEAANYFSAYSVNDEYIDDIEKLLIRIVPNDILNKRMEGNGSLEMHISAVDN